VKAFQYRLRIMLVVIEDRRDPLDEELSSVTGLKETIGLSVKVGHLGWKCNTSYAPVDDPCQR
jgi:hypothetical protein